MWMWYRALSIFDARYIDVLFPNKTNPSSGDANEPTVPCKAVRIWAGRYSGRLLTFYEAASHLYEVVAN